MKKILLDTDIGYDIDDAVCLAYLLAQPECELLGITTVTGEGDRRAQMASAICHVAGKSVPIYVGAEEPLVISQRQPKTPQADALGDWEHDKDFPHGEAVEFLRQSIRAHPGEITLLAIGPLTNVALLFSVDPEIPSLLHELVIMNGYFIGDDNPLEWNVLLDPHASYIVYRAKPPRFRAVGLDVTLKVEMPPDEVRERFSPRLLQPVLDFAEVWFRERDDITFHDPLAAVALFDDEVCEFAPGRVEVVLSGAAGATRWTPDDGAHVEIATSVDVDRFFERFFGVF